MAIRWVIFIALVQFDIKPIEVEGCAQIAMAEHSIKQNLHPPHLFITFVYENAGN